MVLLENLELTFLSGAQSIGRGYVASELEGLIGEERELEFLKPA